MLVYPYTAFLGVPWIQRARGNLPNRPANFHQAGLRVYALDLLGNGYTDKLDPVSQDSI